MVTLSRAGYFVLCTIALSTSSRGSYSPDVGTDDIQNNLQHVVKTNVEGGSSHESRELQEYIERTLDSLRNYDICKNGDSFGRCDIDVLRERMDECGVETCFNRSPMRRSEGDGYRGDRKDPLFYIDYEEVYCTNPNTSCDRCWLGRWCQRPKRCIHGKVIKRFKRRGKVKQLCPGGWAPQNSRSRRD